MLDWLSPTTAAVLYAVLVGVIVLFQLALTAGAPWGELTMGGVHPGRLPSRMRVAAVLQAALLVVLAGLVLARAGVALPAWTGVARWGAWAAVAVSGLTLVLNLITPSRRERLLWAPVAVALVVCSLRVALGG